MCKWVSEEVCAERKGLQALASCCAAKILQHEQWTWERRRQNDHGFNMHGPGPLQQKMGCDVLLN